MRTVKGCLKQIHTRGRRERWEMGFLILTLTPEDIREKCNSSINRGGSSAHIGQGSWDSSSSLYLFLRRRSTKYLGFCKSPQRLLLIWVV